MADLISTTSNSSKDYQKQLLNTMVVAPVFEQFALRGKITGTKYVTWNRINRISPGTPAAIGLGITPSPMLQTPDEVTATADWYAAYTKIARQAWSTDPNGQVKAMGTAMGKHGNELREVIIRNAIVSGATTTYYSAGGSIVRSTVVAVINSTDLNRIGRALYASGAEKITSIIKAGSGVGTTPIGASYICVIHPSVELDVRAISTFTPVEKYPNSTPGFIGEIGSIPGFRFITSNIMADLYYPGSATAGGSSTGKLTDDGSHANVYPNLIFGEQAFGVVDLEKFETIEKGLDKAGSAVNAYSTTGYIMAMVAKALNGSWCAVYECAASL
jgi:N4-gp56 family major capsid protein